MIIMIACSQLTFASTTEGLYVPLQYDNHYLHNHQKIHTDYISVVAEDISFPDYSQLDLRQKARYEKAVAIIETVLNSDEFKRKVLSYKRSDGSRLYQKNYLWSNKAETLTNEEVLSVIIRGDEKMRPGTFNEMNINSWVKKCNWWQRAGIWCRKVIGSTSPSSSFMIKHNWKFYKNYETHQMVANIVHEWLHLLGFLHGNENMREEVPYVVGSIAGEVAQQLLNE